MIMYSVDYIYDKVAKSLYVKFILNIIQQY